MQLVQQNLLCTLSIQLSSLSLLILLKVVLLHRISPVYVLSLSDTPLTLRSVTSLPHQPKLRPRARIRRRLICISWCCPERLASLYHSCSGRHSLFNIVLSQKIIITRRKMYSQLGTSLLVPSVYELAKQPITKVPEQYLRPNQEPVIIASNTITDSPQIPIVDLNKLLSEDGHADELDNLDYACKEWGFFQLINHGVNPSLVENVKRGIKEFLSLPLEEKKKFWQTPADMQGFGQMFVTSENQKLEWADMFIMSTLPSNERNSRLFPNIPQPFRENLESYCLELEKLCTTIIKQIEKALKTEPNEVLELFDDLSQAMRVNHYPPCSQPENVIGINPHSDAGALTILLQANDIEGLQIRKDGQWISVKPLTNSFVINIGDTMEILTNGLYRSIEHRGTINSKNERISIATFHRPQMSKVIGPTPSLVTPERPALFKRIVVRDYYKAYFSRELQGKSCLDTMKIQNEISK